MRHNPRAKGLPTKVHRLSTANEGSIRSDSLASGAALGETCQRKYTVKPATDGLRARATGLPAKVHHLSAAANAHEEGASPHSAPSPVAEPANESTPVKQGLMRPEAPRHVTAG
jgi:hypothetical protein